MKAYIIPEQLLAQLVVYLRSQPMERVEGLVASLRQLQAVEVKQDEVKGSEPLSRQVKRKEKREATQPNA